MSPTQPSVGGHNLAVNPRRRLAAALVVAACAVAGCSSPSADVVVTNRTGRTIRLTGSCVADDPHTLAPGTRDDYYYLGAQCRIDDGDGRHGVLGCVTLATRHTDVTRADLHRPPRPGECWKSGNRH